MKLGANWGIRMRLICDKYFAMQNVIAILRLFVIDKQPYLNNNSATFMGLICVELPKINMYI